MKINAKNYSDLIQQLTNYPVSVAVRGRGRTTEQTENWASTRLLPTLAKISIIEFPACVTRQDRPDLRIKTPSRSIGIELTEVVPPAYAQAVAERNKHYPDATVDRSIFSWGANFSPKDIHNHLAKVGDNLTGPGWKSDSIEKEWAVAVNDSISKKTEKLNGQGFDLFQFNWLSAYSSSPGPMLKINHACSFLKPPSAMPGKYKFDIVFVLISKKLVVLTDTDFQIEDQIVI